MMPKYAGPYEYHGEEKSMQTKVLDQKSHWRYRFRCEDNIIGCLVEKHCEDNNWTKLAI